MSDFFPADHRKLPQRGGRSPAAAGIEPGMPVLPAALMASAVTVLLLAAAGVLFSGSWVAGEAGLALAAAAQAAAAAWAAAAAAWAVRQRGRRQLAALRSASAESRSGLLAAADAVRRGEAAPVPEEPGPPLQALDPYALLGYDLRLERHAARLALAQAAGRTDSRVEVIINLARRVQSLLHREIREIDEIERQAEDPDLLKSLFSVDHLATRMRRYTESLAVLGGAAARRHWSRPVPLDHVLRAAVAETEHYARVTIVPPVPGIVLPAAVADVIHLVAELVENATKFSPPAAQVMVRAGEVAAGLAIDVEDRGLGMDPANRARINNILAGQADVGIGELLADGRIGMFVVSALARRHGITAELRRNVFGGTQAVIVLPPSLGRAGSQHGAGMAGQVPAVSEAGPGLPRAPGTPGLPRRASRPDTGTGIDIPAPAAGNRLSPGLPPSSRPPLPRRGGGSHMAPPLRGGRVATAPDPADGASHDPGLMANFLKGVQRGEAAGGTAEPPWGPR
jgi:signal transduction histidine kinase